MISFFQFAGICDRLKEGSTSIRSTVFVEGLGESQRNWHLIIQRNPLFDVSESIIINPNVFENFMAEKRSWC